MQFCSTLFKNNAHKNFILKNLKSMIQYDVTSINVKVEILSLELKWYFTKYFSNSLSSCTWNLTH